MIDHFYQETLYPIYSSYAIEIPSLPFFYKNHKSLTIRRLHISKHNRLKSQKK